MSTIEIKRATEQDSEILAHLGSTTYIESHGHFIEDKDDLNRYLISSFSQEKVKQELRNQQNLFYLIFTNDLPVGYAKVVLNSTHESVSWQNACRLERIYILEKHIPLKLGKPFLTFIEKQAKDLKFDALWLSVYIKNQRAIRFYQKNDFLDVGRLNFMVNGKGYENLVLSKEL